MTKEKNYTDSRGIYRMNEHNLDETNICWDCGEDFDFKDPDDIECKKKKDDSK